MNSTSPIPTVTGIADEQRRDTAEATHDWSGDVPLSTTVLSLVASVSRVDVENLPTLNDAIDPDALDALFAPRECGTRRPSGAVSFRLDDYLVSVDPNGTVNVEMV